LLGGYIGFISLYFAEYIANFIFNGFKLGDAYHQIGFEKEAYNNEAHFSKKSGPYNTKKKQHLITSKNQLFSDTSVDD